MSAEWPLKTLKDCATWYSGGTPSRSNPDFWDGSIPWISAKSLKEFFIQDSEDKVSELGAQSGTRLMPAETILFIVRGMSLKKEFRVGITTRTVTFNQDLKALVACEGILPLYLAYAIKSRTSEILGMVGEAGHGTGVLPTDRIESLLIPVPEIEEQKRIVHVIKTLDDKIELNRQINQTLEQIAQTIFKSWFVDFEPVKAKIEGKAAGRDPERAAMCAISGKLESELDQLPPEQYQQLAATAALFPDELVESELGLIPAGWEVSPLGDYLDVLATGRRPKGGVSAFREGIPSVGAESINGVGNFDYSKTKFIPTDFFEKMKSGLVEDYDVLLYKDGGKPGDFKPRVSLFGEGFPFTKFAINEHVFRMRSSRLGQPFLYFQLGYERVLADLRHRGAKAAIPGINQGDVNTLNFLIPKKELTAEFNEVCSSLLKKILTGAIEMQNLATLRDTLLPMLLSGEIASNFINGKMTQAI